MKPKCLAIAVLAIINLVVGASATLAQCRLIDNSRDELFISFERTGKVTSDDGKQRDGVVLRLHNNSSCAVVIKTGSFEKFYKPLPEKPTPQQKFDREIDYELPDGALVPDLEYTYFSREGASKNVGGHVFFGFTLLEGRTILFEVPSSHLEFKFEGRIEIFFEYAWESQHRAKGFYPSVVKLVRFYAALIPEDVQRKLKKR